MEPNSNCDINMEEFKKKTNAGDTNDKDIVYSQAVKAGKRIYYLDVKKNRKDEMFIAITESKKIVSGEGENPQVSFEKHKIFLYQEDFDKFLHGLHESIDYIRQRQGSAETGTKFGKDAASSKDSETEGTPLLDQTINIDIDF